MSNIGDLLDGEAQQVQPSTDWMGPTMAKVGRRRRSRRLATAVLSLGVATMGILVAVRAFGGSPSLNPSTEGQPNYEFYDVTIHPGDGSEPTVGVAFRMRFEEYPGVHRCTWRAFGADGGLVGEHTRLFAQPGPISEPPAIQEVPAIGPAVRGEAFCEPARLDTPGITDVSPVPVGAEVNLEQRVAEWAARFEVEAMSRVELEANVFALKLEWGELGGELDPEKPEGWAEFEELRLRADRLLSLMEGEASPGATEDAKTAGRETKGPPDDRFVLAEGEDGGTGWEVFTSQDRGTFFVGWALDTGEWALSEINEVDPCRIESDSINWIYLHPVGGYPIWSPPDRIVVLQFHALPPEATGVGFLLSDGRAVDARVVRIPDDRAPWDAFVVVFEGRPGLQVDEVTIEAADGSRLDDPATC
jgi:hypothetical protein